MYRSRHIIIFTASFVIGGLWFALQYGFLVIRFPRVSQSTGVRSSSRVRKKIKIPFFKGTSWSIEQREVLWDDQFIGHTAEALCKLYWGLVEEEGLVTPDTSVQMAMVGKNGSELFCSLSHNPFRDGQSTYQSLLVVEGLLRLIRENFPRIATVRLLVQHEPCKHTHLDFSQPWPVGGFLKEQHKVLPERAFDAARSLTIVLDPAGDLRDAGRTLGDEFERTLTYRLAESLERAVSRMTTARIIIARHPGERRELFQTASYANRLPADLVLHLSLFPSQQERPEFFVYALSYQPDVDVWMRISEPLLEFLPFHDAHRRVLLRNYAAMTQLQASLQQQRVRGFILHEGRMVPYKPLVGMTVPAVGIECGMRRSDQLEEIAAILSNALVALLEASS